MNQDQSVENVQNLFEEEEQQTKKVIKNKHKFQERQESQEQQDSFLDDSDDNDDLDDQDDDEEQERPGKRKGKPMLGKLKKKKKKKGLEAFIEDEASQSDRDQEDDDDPEDAEIRNQDAKKRTEDYYKRPKKTDNFFTLIGQKDDEQLKKIIQMRSYSQYVAESNCPSSKDPKVFQIPVFKGKQDALTLAILNKASQLKDKKDKALNICSVMSMKRKFPGYIFVQAMTERDVKTALQGFLDIMLRQMQPIKDDQYQNLFKERDSQSTTLKQAQYIRIRGGRYDGDLGKIYKIRKNGPDVILQPRIDMTKFLNQIKAITDSDIADKDKSYVRVVKKYFGSRDIVDHKYRPDKCLIPYDQLPNLQINRKPKLTTEGMIILSFSFGDVTKQLGTITLKQFESFKKDDALSDFARKQLKYLSSTINIAKGDEVEIIHGDTKGVYGIVREVNQNVAVIQPKNNSRIGILEEQIEKLAKRFRLKQMVTVIAGNYQGKTGRILKIQNHQATILTENNNQIIANTNNLKLADGTSKTEEAMGDYRKNDLVLTLGVGDGVGMVLSASRDALTILDLNNSVKVISVMDIDKKLDTRNNKAINSYKEEIKQGTTVRIIDGKYAGKKVEVRHVYKNNIFVTSNDIGTPNGAYVIKDTNCTVITQSSTFKPKPHFGNNKPNNNFNSQTNMEDQQLAPGKIVTIKSGQYKGYQGQIINSYSNNYQVKLTAKLGKKVIIKRDDIISQKKTIDMGKTPRVSGSSYVPQSPAPIGITESRRDRSFYD